MFEILDQITICNIITFMTGLIAILIGYERKLKEENWGEIYNVINSGRVNFINWGKNVKITEALSEIRKKGTVQKSVSIW